MKPYTTAHAAKEHRERLRSELRRSVTTEPLSPQRLAVLRRELGMDDQRLIARRPHLVQLCHECGHPVYNGLEMGGVYLCRECVTLAAELLKIRTKRK